MTTMQEFLDEAARYLRTMACRAEGPNTSTPGTFRCLYETPGGRRCVAGHFFPDGHPALGAHGDIADVLSRYPDIRDLLAVDVGRVDGDPTVAFWSDLQWIHDARNNWSPAGFKGEESLEELAEAWGLTHPVPA